MVKKNISLKHVFITILMVSGFVCFVGCAQVPKEAVELSTTVGKDVAQVYQSHKELAKILFERMKNDVNKFIDTVYAPYQVKKQLKDDYDDFKSGVEDSLFAKLNFAVNNPENQKAQLEVLEFMEIFLEVVREDIESFRQETISPVLEQEKALLSAIDRSYNQIHYANSIVTGHLASIVKVHDAQEELLNEFGVDGLRKDIGKSLADMSEKVSEFTDKGKEIDATLDETEKKIEEWQTKFHGLFAPETDNS